MTPWTLPLSLLIAAAAPLLALRYLRTILLQVLTMICDARGGAEFWWRVTNVLALCGSVLLMLTFGNGDQPDVNWSDFLRRTLWLVTAGIFVSVAIVANQVWSNVQAMLRERARVSAPAAAAAGSVTAAATAAAPHPSTAAGAAS
ncbi:MAG: hypothetical protein EOP37_01435 [Rubrivivax sp.]|nr:MAG: hypothetical protein EOP37_01435 [Rubrivivax sp.]